MPEIRSARRPPHVDLGRAPYFVTSRTFESRTLFRGAFGEAAVTRLLADRQRYGFLLLAYAFMPDHAHFVIVPAHGHTISTTMRVVKGGIARQINIAMGAKGAVWQDGFYDKVARTMEQLNAYIEYTHRNPVVAGLVSREAEYALSSADGRCMGDYERFLNEPFVANTSPARAGKPTLRGERGGVGSGGRTNIAPESGTARAEKPALRVTDDDARAKERTR